MNNKLTNPPLNERSKELWLQHAAGHILFKDVREYAISKIDESDLVVKEKIIKGIDDSVYGLMMILDGVTGSLSNENYSVEFRTKILLRKDDKIIQELDTLDGDGMCMGYHSWKEGDFGDDKVIANE